MEKKHIVIAAVVVLLLIICGVAVGISLGGRGGEEAGSQGSAQAQATAAQSGFTPDLDENAQNWMGEALEDKTSGESEGIKIPGYPSITIPAGEKTVQMALLNPEGNPCYFTFELELKDTGDVLYTSKLVPPGQAIYEVTLSEPLAAGEYNAVIRITTASLEDGSAMNGANVETLLIAE